MKEYTNYLSKFGVSDEAAKDRCKEIFNTIFYGADGERFYTPVGSNMGYIEDTGNHDARTEGMSYGMMMCVQMDRQEEFNRLWKWARTYMYMDKGPNKGYFAWSCKTNGEKNAYGAAPDGEEFFIMSLIFAGNRWGNSEGIFDYHSEAGALLHTCINKGYDGTIGKSMFDAETGLIKFIAEEDFSDPSYHLPHFMNSMLRLQLMKKMQSSAEKLHVQAESTGRRLVIRKQDFQQSMQPMMELPRKRISRDMVVVMTGSTVMHTGPYLILL